MSAIQTIAYACGLGATNEGCQHGPTQLLESGLIPYLKEQGIYSLEAEVLHPRKDGTRQDKLEGILSQLAKLVYETRLLGHLPVILGGDHSSAMGTWAGVCESINGQGDWGLLWIDAHMDSHTARTSPSGAEHGMPLANLLGEGDANLMHIGGKEQKLLAKHTCILGVRSYEAEEKALLDRIGLQVFYMHDIRQQGMTVILQKAMEIVGQGTVGFGMSMDLDALDPKIAPGVGTPAEEGLNQEELDLLIEAVQDRHEDLLALELVEYNPSLDKGHTTEKLIFSTLNRLLHPWTN